MVKVLNGPVDQTGRSSDSHSEGRGFKSPPVHHILIPVTHSETPAHPTGDVLLVAGDSSHDKYGT